ncbi:penicillin acylase family protein [Sphingomonas aerophila]|uniref:Acyl-homoserine-lactone acylase n=1 Tax=Sphingomonas aerophila TaxID=1344948 RepID=A0A7W9EX27_9SPHN|nr:penicillin acylase family protein [Sphingomonas aerophila]MBB5716332.1 acyl-homoserine-lactone acylase [Sphingomonas aerophila]
MRRLLLLAPLLLSAAPDPEGARLRARADSVTIARDDWGIAHIRGQTDADAVFGMIYAQAEDDFPRIEANYLTALGRTAEADGEGAIWADLRQRLWNDPERLKADYARAPAWLRKLCQGWADGLNLYLQTHPTVHPRVLTRFEPWMPLAFSEGSIGGDIERVPLTQLRSFYEGRQLAWTADERGRIFHEPKGSNGIAIAPARTRDGHALLLINPHTSFFFRAEQQVTSGEGLNAYGAATWGQFFIYQGWNPDAGWMHTSSGVDNVDEFAEDVTGSRYRYGQEQRRLTTRAVTIRFRRGNGSVGLRTFTTYATHHGPITRAEGGRWIATALMNRPLAALEQSFLRTKTRNLAGYTKVAGLQANSSNNTLFADRKGEIAFLMPQFMPVRDARFDYTRPVDGSDPATGWHGLHSLSSLPQAVQPSSGWAYNSNDAPWSAAGAGSINQATYPGYFDQVGRNARTLHALELLQKTAPSPWTLDKLVGAAFDTRLPAFDILLPRLTAAWATLAPSDPRRAALAQPVMLLKNWDRRWGTESTATSLAVFWGEELFEATGGGGARSLARFDMAAAAPDEVQLAVLSRAVARLNADFGRWQVPWGEINRFQRNDGAIVQRFDDNKPSLPVGFPSAQWGTLASFGGKRYPGTRRYYGTSGNSFVAAVEFGPRVRARAVTAGGESGDPASPHFNDQATRYATGALRPVYFWPDELRGHIEREYRPGR